MFAPNPIPKRAAVPDAPTLAAPPQSTDFDPTFVDRLASSLAPADIPMPRLDLNLLNDGAPPSEESGLPASHARTANQKKADPAEWPAHYGLHPPYNAVAR